MVPIIRNLKTGMSATGARDEKTILYRGVLHVGAGAGKHAGDEWRCLIAKLPRRLYSDPYAQRIALNYVEEHYRDFDVYEFAFYWLRSGHIFLLFQGRMKQAHDTFASFLDFVSEGEDHAKPPFHLYNLGREAGWVEDAFEEALAAIETMSKGAERAIKDRRIEAPEQAGPPPEQRDRDAERALRLRPLLLLVEDERMTQSFIRALTDPYCDIIAADTVAEGRALYEACWPNMVFMDINLPDGDGQDLTQQLQALDPQAYIVIVSANLSRERVEGCRNAGAKGFVAKPVTSDKERLIAPIHNYNRERYRQA